MDTNLPPELAHTSTARLHLDIARLCELVATGDDVDGEAVLSESRWVVCG